MSANRLYTDQFRKNDDVFRNTMESIFQKYSSISDPGIDVCLETMTCRTGRGPVPIDSAQGERELEALKTRVKADHSMRELEDQEKEQYQMDMSGVTEDDMNSYQKESNENLWHSGNSFQLSMNSLNSSRSCLWGVSQGVVEEELDEELERTLSSHGSTLLDVYPSMLSQIGEAYRRQHVTEKARAVLQKYRRKHRHAGQSHSRSAVFKNRHDSTLNKTMESSFTKQRPVQRNLFKNELKSSPLKNSSYESSACFYSPRRDRGDESRATDESPWNGLRLDRKPKQNSVRVIDFSTPSVSTSISDQSLDLNQTYDIGPAVLPTSYAVPCSSVSNSPRPAWHSPVKSAKGLSLLDQRGISVTSLASYQQSTHSSLDRESFRDHLHSLVSSPQRSNSNCFSPSRKNTFRPTMRSVEGQQSRSAAIQSPKQRSPRHYLAHFEVHRSPYSGKQVPLSSPQRSLYYNGSDHQQKLSLAKKYPSSSRLSKRHRSFSGPQSTSWSKYDSSSELQIDAEFRKMYHHFVCRGTSSPCPASHCHLCERQQKETSRSPHYSSSSMSALALTPLRATLKKRRRQPEVEESLRFKRFRESRSPLKHLQAFSQKLDDSYMTPVLSEPREDKRTWNRAVLLQCPSPHFLRGSGNLRRIRESKLAMQMNPHAPSWTDVPNNVHADLSPMRTFNPGTVSLSPSLSRRRLQYGLLQ